MGRTPPTLLRRILRARFWVEAALGVVSLTLLVLTQRVPDWIEAVFRIDPDRHSGSLEWAIGGVLLVGALAASALARLEWRRPQAVAPSRHPH